MIIGKNSLKKGGLLFLGVSTIAVCIFAAIASEEIVLQIIAGAALVSTAVGAYKIYTSMES